MLFQDLNIREVLSCRLLVVICAFLFGLWANLFALPSTKCHLNAFTILFLTELPKYHGNIPTLFLTTWSPMKHPLCFANVTWFHFGISHLVMFCSMGVESSTSFFIAFFSTLPLTPKHYYGPLCLPTWWVMKEVNLYNPPKRVSLHGRAAKAVES